jgi:hypothetical protein
LYFLNRALQFRPIRGGFKVEQKGCFRMGLKTRKDQIPRQISSFAGLLGRPILYTDEELVSGDYKH